MYSKAKVRTPPPVCLQVIFAFYQIVMNIETTYSIHMPQYWIDATRVFRVFNIDWLAYLLPDECIGSFNSRLQLTAFSPIALIFIIFVIVVLCADHACIESALAHLVDRRRRLSWQVGTNSRPSKTPRSSSRRGLFKQRSWTSSASRIGEAPSTAMWIKHKLLKGLLSTMPFALFLTFVLVSSVSSSVFQVWACEPFEYAAGEDHYFLRKDYSIQCYSSEEHARARHLAYALIVIWPVGVLILYTTLLFRARSALRLRRRNRLVRSIAFLHRDCATLALDPITSRLWRSPSPAAHVLLPLPIELTGSTHVARRSSGLLLLGAG